MIKKDFIECEASESDVTKRAKSHHHVELKLEKKKKKGKKREREKDRERLTKETVVKQRSAYFKPPRIGPQMFTATSWW